MTPEEVKRVNDLRMRALQALHEGKDVRTVLTREELTEALAIIRAARRQAADSSINSRVKTAAANTKVDKEALAAKLGLDF